MKTLWMDIDDLQGAGQTFRLGGDEVLLVCRGGESTFPQNDEGWESLRRHDFEQHERIMHYDWTELHGQQVTILVVERVDKPERLLYPDGRQQTELVARTNDGTYYFLPFSYYNSAHEGGFKWKPKGDGLKSLLQISSADTPNDQGLVSLGLDVTDESSDHALAGMTSAPDGSR